MYVCMYVCMDMHACARTHICAHICARTYTHISAGGFLCRSLYNHVLADILLFTDFLEAEISFLPKSNK